MNTLKSELIDALVAKAVAKALAAPPEPSKRDPLKENAARRHESFRKRFGSLRTDAYLSDE